MSADLAGAPVAHAVVDFGEALPASKRSAAEITGVDPFVVVDVAEGEAPFGHRRERGDGTSAEPPTDERGSTSAGGVSRLPSCSCAFGKKARVHALPKCIVGTP